MGGLSLEHWNASYFVGTARFAAGNGALLNQFRSGRMYMCIVARTINAPLGAPISYYRAPNNVIDQVSGHLVPFWKFWSKSGPNNLFLSKRSEFLAQSVVVPEKKLFQRMCHFGA